VPVTPSRRATPVTALLLVALLATGCPATAPAGTGSSPVDRLRAETMRADPLLSGVDAPVVSLGRDYGDATGWDRGEVTGDRYRRAPGDPPPAPDFAAAAAHLAAAVAAARAAGWTVYHAACRPPAPHASTPGQPGYADPALDVYVWRVYAYRLVDRVSYWAFLELTAQRNGGAVLAVTLRAPNHRDPDDLFPDRPAALAAGGTCVESPGAPADPVAAGTPADVRRRVGPVRVSTAPDPLHR